MRDSLYWKVEKNGLYSVRASFAIMEGELGSTLPLNMI